MRWSFHVAGLLVVALVALTAVDASAQRGSRQSRGSSSRRRATASAEAEPSTRGSTSIGRHNRGRLSGGHRLEDSTNLRLKRPDGPASHGTDELVALLEGGAAAVAAEFPGSRLTVGDLSHERGGRFGPHRSHRSGRDVDVGFYVTNESGEVLYLDRFVDFRADGTSREDPSYRFDDARNWAFVSALLGQDAAPVQYMFVARWLKARLLAHAANVGASPELIARADVVLYQPSRGGRHEDHFHVRVYCAHDDRPRCVDDPPFHAWVPTPSAEEMQVIRANVQRDRAARQRQERRDRQRRERRAASRRGSGSRG